LADRTADKLASPARKGAKSRVRTGPGRQLAIEAARIAEDNNADDIVVLDLRDISPVADYFVIATGTSSPQMRAICERVSEYGRGVGQRPYHVAGTEGGQWAVLDFVDVVVHVFGVTHRRYYDLEMIWGAAPRVRWKRPASAKKAPQTGLVTGSRGDSEEES
jgi:ribosome-associated protein